MGPSGRTAGGARSLPARYYLSQEVYERERQRVFQRHWLCVGRAEPLAGSGSHAVVEVEGESLLLVRDDQGVLRCFYNLCRHRGTRLCQEARPQRLHAIRCPYHAWTYDLAGRLTAAPNMDGVAAFDPAEYPLREVAVRVWQGFVMVHLGLPAERPEEVSESLDMSLGSLTGRVEPWGPSQLVTAARLEYDVRANWKLLFQNYSECYHCPWVHPSLNALTPFKTAENDLQQGGVLGGPMRLADSARSMTRDGSACGRMLEGLDQRQRRSVVYYTLFPTLFLSLHPDFVLVHQLERRSTDRTRVVCEFLFPADEVARSDFDPQPAVEFWDQTNRQDWEVCEWSQQGVASAAYEPGPYSNLESVVAAFDRHYLQVLEDPEPLS